MSKTVLAQYPQAPGGYTVSVDCNYPFAPPIPGKDVIGREVKEAVENFMEEMRRDLGVTTLSIAFTNIACMWDDTLVLASQTARPRRIRA